MKYRYLKESLWDDVEIDDNELETAREATKDSLNYNELDYCAHKAFQDIQKEFNKLNSNIDFGENADGIDKTVKSIFFYINNNEFVLSDEYCNIDDFKEYLQDLIYVYYKSLYDNKNFSSLCIKISPVYILNDFFYKWVEEFFLTPIYNNLPTFIKNRYKAAIDLPFNVFIIESQIDVDENELYLISDLTSHSNIECNINLKEINKIIFPSAKNKKILFSNNVMIAYNSTNGKIEMLNIHTSINDAKTSMNAFSVQLNNLYTFYSRQLQFLKDNHIASAADNDISISIYFSGKEEQVMLKEYDKFVNNNYELSDDNYKIIDDMINIVYSIFRKQKITQNLFLFFNLPVNNLYNAPLRVSAKLKEKYYKNINQKFNDLNLKVIFNDVI